MNVGTGKTTVPIVEEQPVVEKRETQSHVRIKTTTGQRDEWVEEELRHENVTVERVPIDRYVESIPEPRQDGDRLIIPLVEEVMVVEKRLLLREELHIVKTASHEAIREKVTLRHTEASVERD